MKKIIISPKVLDEIKQQLPSFQLGSPHPNFKHVFDCSGSCCLRTVDFENGIVQTTPAMDSNAEKNHPDTEKGRRRLYLFGLVDSYSGYLVAKYFAIPAPNSTAMSQFLLETWQNTG
jgi:hypothetical protein